MLNVDRDDRDVHLRAVAARLGLPYVELYQADMSGMYNPDTTRDDLDDWLDWCREHAPERLATPPAEAQPGKRKGRK